uniref:Uncharacterized protein n=1 Tax=Arundo donax TaxID=35708 RepID=A0A0A9AW47_ARUDO
MDRCCRGVWSCWVLRHGRQGR